MKKRRRIEITAFRRRTTVVFCVRSEVVPAGPPPPGEDNASHPAHADPARAAESDLDQSLAGAPDTVRHFGLAGGANDRRPT